jgi:enoyl-[acyl-carrier protein] reductase II
LKSTFSREFKRCEKDAGYSLEQLEALGAGALRLAVLEGDEVKGCFMAGQIASMVKCEQSAKEIIEEICGEAEQILLGANKWIR